MPSTYEPAEFTGEIPKATIDSVLVGSRSGLIGIRIASLAREGPDSSLQAP
ncbi:hypothetical protein [Streptomyces cyaneofuscatus]|uniref:hypothetical protein n=1 Tax=Streptomyces cyaneofuscatus TaxID=66883 RepID=UPI00380B327A